MLSNKKQYRIQGMELPEAVSSSQVNSKPDCVVYWQNKQ